MLGLQERKRFGCVLLGLLNPKLWVFLDFSGKLISYPPTREVVSKKTAFRILQKLVQAVALCPYSHVTRQILHFLKFWALSRVDGVC